MYMLCRYPAHATDHRYFQCKAYLFCNWHSVYNVLQTLNVNFDALDSVQVVSRNILKTSKYHGDVWLSSILLLTNSETSFDTRTPKYTTSPVFEHRVTFSWLRHGSLLSCHWMAQLPYFQAFWTRDADFRMAQKLCLGSSCTMHGRHLLAPICGMRTSISCFGVVIPFSTSRTNLRLISFSMVVNISPLICGIWYLWLTPFIGAWSPKQTMFDRWGVAGFPRTLPRSPRMVVTQSNAVSFLNSYSSWTLFESWR